MPDKLTGPQRRVLVVSQRSGSYDTSPLGGGCQRPDAAGYGREVLALATAVSTDRERDR